MNTKGHELTGWMRCAGAGLGLLALFGCSLPQPQVDRTRHFTLGEPAGAVVADGVRVRPVLLAGHLRNRALAVRVGPNEVIYLEEARWAEPLDEAITQLLRARLGGVAGGAVVSVQVQRCEVDRAAGNAVLIAASYSISVKGVERVGTFTAAPRTWDGKNPSGLVGLLREGLGELAEAIAQAAGG